MTSFAETFERSAFGKRFRFAQHRTTPARDTVAGITTFIVMSYIIFVNPAILGFAGIEGLEEAGLPFDAVLTSTCLVAGVMTILMGLYTNRAYAIAPGLGLNAVVAFTLVANEGLSFPEAMGLIVVEGLAITILVLLGLRESIMRAIPLELKKAIAIGIGLFIAFIGLFNSGLVVRGAATPVDLADFTTWTVLITIFGLILTIGLRAVGFPGDLLVGIVLTTAFATIVNYAADVYPEGLGYARWPDDIVSTPDFSLVGEFSFGAFTTLPFLAAVTFAFTLFLADFFDTMGTLVGVGGRTGWVSVVTGALFFPFMFLAPLIGMVPPQATAPALIIVGWLMISVLTEVEEEAELESGDPLRHDPTTGTEPAVARRPTTPERRLAGIDFHDIAVGLSAAIVIMLMPFTFSITDGIAAGFIVYVLVRIFQGQWARVHPLMYASALAFTFYFLAPLLQQELSWI
jgi:AGZA family xanthine/uracil permease-like MFS transporter